MLVHLAQLEIRRRAFRVLETQFSEPKGRLLVLLLRLAHSSIIKGEVCQVLHGLNVVFLSRLIVKLVSLIPIFLYTLSELVTSSHVVQRPRTSLLTGFSEPFGSLCEVTLVIIKQRAERVHRKYVTLRGGFFVLANG